MKKYNRALNWTVRALAELRAGKPVLAARLLASAAKESDVGDAIAILEASNKPTVADIKTYLKSLGIAQYAERIKAGPERSTDYGVFPASAVVRMTKNADPKQIKQLMVRSLGKPTKSFRRGGGMSDAPYDEVLTSYWKTDRGQVFLSCNIDNGSTELYLYENSSYDPRKWALSH